MHSWLRLGDDGSIAPDDGARAELARRPGRYLLAPTTPDLLIGLRLPSREGAPPVGRVSFCGDLDGVPFSDVVGLLAQGRRNGLLRILCPSADRWLLFRGGEIRAASSSHPGERLGEVAIRLGLLRRGDLARLLEQKKGATGERLLAAGLLDRESLDKAVEAQIKAVFFAILLHPTGAFVFGEHTGAELPGPTISAHGLILEGFQLLDELALIRQRIPSARATVRLVKPARWDEPLETELLGALGAGPRTIASLAEQLHVPEIDATRAVFHLLGANLVELIDDGTAAALADLGTDPSQLLETIRGFNQVFQAIFAAVRQLPRAVPEVEGRESFFAGIRFSEDGSLPPGELLERLPEEARKAGTSPRTFLLDSLQPAVSLLLYLAAPRLDPEAEADLHRRVEEIFRRLEW